MEYVNLRDICKINMGQSPESTSYNSDKQGVPFYQGNADFGALYPNPRIWCSKPIKLAKENDILISVRAPVGALNFSKEECCIGRGLAAITLDSNDFLLEFIYWSLRTGVKELQSKSTGSTFKSVNKKTLEEVRIPKISLKEQKDIIRNLTLLTNILAKYKHEIVFLDELVKARFVEMFGNPANNPYNFSKMKLGKICDVRDGTHDSPKYQTVGYPLITSKNLTSGEIDFSNCNYIKEEDYKKINLRSEVTRGDIIMPMIGTIGNPIIVNTDIRFAIKNVALIKFNNNTLQNIYVKYFLGSDYFDFSVLRNIRGGTQKFIALKDLRDLDILVPPLELQNQFASFVQEVDKSRSRIQKSLEASQELFDSLMQEYFG